MQLRPYQEDLVARVSAAFRAGAASVLLQLGTGGGKTATSADILRRGIDRGYRCLFLAHLDTLIEDTHARLTAAGVPVGFIQAGRPSDPTAPVQVASLQTLHVRGERPPADFVILDECHRAMASSVRALLRAYESAALLGLTATPQRGDGKPLGDVFEEMISGPSVRWLMDQGFLVPCDVVAPMKHMTRGLAGDPVSQYMRHTPGRRALFFAGTKAHATRIVDGLTRQGITAQLVLGDTPRAVRTAVRNLVTRGEVRALVGVGVFVEGFDLPAIETIVLARAFTVTGSYLQAIGRGLRPSPETGKTKCTVLDLRGAVNLHGLPQEDRRWALQGSAVVRTDAKTALRRCTECMAIFKPARECPRCGARHVPKERVERVMSKGERLEEWSHMPQWLRDAKYLEQLQKVAVERMNMLWHNAQAWALKKFRDRFNREPVSREGGTAA